MPTLRRLAATELMSFSLIHDLKSLTAKAADTPGGKTRALCQIQIKDKLFKSRSFSPSLTRFSLKRLLRIEADILPLASRMPVSMASLLRSDSVNPLRNSSSYRGTGRSTKGGQGRKNKKHSCDPNQSGHFLWPRDNSSTLLANNWETICFIICFSRFHKAWLNGEKKFYSSSTAAQSNWLIKQIFND